MACEGLQMPSPSPYRTHTGHGVTIDSNDTPPDEAFIHDFYSFYLG